MSKVRAFKGLKLNKEERALSRAVERGEFVAVPQAREETDRITRAVKRTLASKTVSVRLNEGDLEEIRARAGRSGLPYQTLIKAVLHQFARGKVFLSI